MSGCSTSLGVLALVGIGLFGALVACPTRHRPARIGKPRPNVTQPRKPGSRGTHSQITFVWTDHNAARSEAEPGLQGNPNNAKRTCSIEISKDRLRETINSFGITKSITDYSFASEEERQEKEARSQEHCRIHGFRQNPQIENRIDVNYQWMLDQSRADLARFNRDLLDLAKESGYKTQREFIGLVASLVQSLKYRIPPDTRTNPDGRRVITGGVTMPLETLSNRWGDCDTRCILLATILGNLQGSRFALLAGDQHAFLGIQASPLVGDRYIQIQGEPYVLVELTDSWPLGILPPELWEKVEGHVYEAEMLE